MYFHEQLENLEQENNGRSQQDCSRNLAQKVLKTGLILSVSGLIALGAGSACNPSSINPAPNQKVYLNNAQRIGLYMGATGTLLSGLIIVPYTMARTIYDVDEALRRR